MAFKRCASIILLQTQTPRCSDKVLDACVLQELLHAYLSNEIDQSMWLFFKRQKKSRLKTVHSLLLFWWKMKRKKQSPCLARKALFSYSYTSISSSTKPCGRKLNKFFDFTLSRTIIAESESFSWLFPGPSQLLKVKVFHDSLKDFVYWETK